MNNLFSFIGLTADIYITANDRKGKWVSEWLQGTINVHPEYSGTI